MKDQLPPEAQRLYGEIEDLQDDAQDVRDRKERAEQRLDDAEAALDALADVDDDAETYRTVGTVRIRDDPAEIRADLEAEADSLEDRIEHLDETEADLREQFENRKREIKHLLGGAGAPGGPGTTGGLDDASGPGGSGTDE